MTPASINSLQWYQAVGVARQSCARFFRDGCQPADAMRAFGLEPGSGKAVNWDKAVDAIAGVLCAMPEKKAA